MTLQLTLMATLVAILGIGGAIFVDKEYGWQRSQHYWPIAVMVAFIAAAFWSTSPEEIFSTSKFFFYVVLAGIILVAYWLPSEEFARWTFRISLGWATFGLIVVEAVVRSASWFTSSDPVPRWIWILTILLFLAALFGLRWYDNRSMKDNNPRR